MKYNICIPIPVKSTSIKELKPIVEKTLKSKPNLIELRFDYISDVNAITADFLRNLLNIIRPHAPVIFTFRDLSEGGHVKLGKKQHFKILKMFIEVKPNYVDIEMNTNIEILDEIFKLSSQNEVNLILSHHNFERTVSLNEAISHIQNFNKRLRYNSSFDIALPKGSIYKIIFSAQTFEDNLIPLRLCKKFSNSNQRIISFCMGTLGIFSRITCVMTGSFLTYAFLEEKTAPGQINIEKMREFYEIILKKK
ncbi:MAG: type I 3-dehydroquinate dehydratase [Promethearchaeota archaeon]